MTKCRQRKGERGVWQRRFYEQTCRDEKNLKTCIDDYHVNALKHGLVTRVADGNLSSFQRDVKLRKSPIDWGNADAWYGDEFINAE